VYSYGAGQRTMEGSFAAYAFLIQEGWFGPSPAGVDEIDVNVRL
jgi:hypothetical protein